MRPLSLLTDDGNSLLSNEKKQVFFNNFIDPGFNSMHIMFSLFSKLLPDLGASIWMIKSSFPAHEKLKFASHTNIDITHSVNLI